VEASSITIMTSRLERKTPGSTQNVRSVRNRIQRARKSMRENLAVMYTWQGAAAAEDNSALPEPLTQAQFDSLADGIYPWRPEGRAATALPYLAARYRDAFAEVCPSPFAAHTCRWHSMLTSKPQFHTNRDDYLFLFGRGIYKYYYALVIVRFIASVHHFSTKRQLAVSALTWRPVSETCSMTYF
jgi:hypothetical protein